MFVSVTHTLLLLGLMQRTKNGLEALRVDIRECNEFWVDRNKSSVTNSLKRCIPNALTGGFTDKAYTSPGLKCMFLLF